MKKALEAHWSGATDAQALLEAAAAVEAQAWRRQADAGIDLIGLDGTLYDQVLDASFQLGLIPERFKVGKVHGQGMRRGWKGTGQCGGGVGQAGEGEGWRPAADGPQQWVQRSDWTGQ